MKLFFDQNLSHKLVTSLSDLYPGSSQTRLAGLDTAADGVIWRFAKENDFTIVTLDSDFAELAAVIGPPPKVVWLRCGNQPSSAIEDRLRDQFEAIVAFTQDAEAACLEVY